MSFERRVGPGGHPVDPNLTYGTPGANLRAPAPAQAKVQVVATKVIPMGDGAHVQVGQRGNNVVSTPSVSGVAYVSPVTHHHHDVRGDAVRDVRNDANARGNAFQQGPRSVKR